MSPQGTGPGHSGQGTTNNTKTTNKMTMVDLESSPEFVALGAIGLSIVKAVSNSILDHFSIIDLTDISFCRAKLF